MSLTKLLASTRFTENSATMSVPDAWLQGRSMFGGLQAALGVQAMRQLVGADMPLRTLQTTFIAPIPPGDVTATAQILRSGKNATHLEAKIIDGDKVLALFIGVFGVLRPSKISRTLEQPKAPDTLPIDFVYQEGLTPSFTSNFTSQWLHGTLPFTGSKNPEAIIDVSMNEEGLTTENHFLAIADFIPPVALSLLEEPSAGSSLTWMLEFLTDDYKQQPLKHWRVDSEMTAAAGGYTSQTATIYAPNGQAIALSRQSMVIFG